MRKFLSILVLGLLAPVAQLSAQPRHEYWFTGEAADNSSLNLVDADSIAQAKEGIKRAWVISYYAASSHRLPGGHDAKLWEFNCRTRQSHLVQLTEYNGSAEPTSSASEDKAEAWSYVVPQSLGEADLGFVCANSASERKAFAIEKLSRISTDAWAKRQFERDANAAAWALLTPEQKLNRYEPNWRQLCASKAFADWLVTAPKWDQEAARRNGNQVVDALEAMIVVEDFQKSQQNPATAASGAGRH